MNNKIGLILVMILMMGIMSITRAQEYGDLREEKDFLQKFSKFWQANDDKGMGEIVRQTGQSIVYSTAKTLAYEGHQLIADGKDGSSSFKIAIKVTEVYAKVYKKKDFLDLIKKYSTYDQQKCKERTVAIYFLKKGDQYFENSVFLDAQTVWENAFVFFGKIEDVSGEADALNNLGKLLRMYGQYSEALQYNKKALETYVKIGDWLGEAGCLLNIGTVYTYQGSYTEGLNYYNRAFDLYKESNNISGMAETYVMLGNSNYYISQFVKALENYLNAFAMYKRIGDISGEADAFSGMGLTYVSLSQYSEAKNYFEKALEMYREIGDKFGEAGALGNLGMVYYNTGQNNEALSYFEKSLEMFRNVGDVNGEANNLLNIGRIYDAIDKYDDAMKYYEESIKLYRNFGNLPGEARSVLNMGLVYGKKGDYTKALEYCQNCLEIMKKIGEVFGEATALINIGDIYANFGQYNKALECYEKSHDIFKEIGDRSSEAVALSKIGDIYYTFGQYSKTLIYCQKSLDISKEIKNLAIEASVLGNFGGVYGSKGQYTKALDYFSKSLEIYDKIGNLSGKAGVVNSIGCIFFFLGNYRESKNYFFKSLEISQEIGDVSGEASALISIGSIFNIYKEYEEGLEIFQEALLKFREIEQVRGETDALHNIGKVYSDLEEYTKALKYWNQSLEIYRKINDVTGEARTLCNLGVIYCKLGKYNDAIQTLQKSIENSEKIGNLELIWRGYEGLGESLWKSGQEKKAIDSYGKAEEVIDMIHLQTKGFKEQEHSFIIGGKRFVYEEFIELLVEIYQKFPDEKYDLKAFALSEKVKSRTFQELMAKAGARTTFIGDEELKEIREKEKMLINEVSRYQGLFVKELSKEERDEGLLKTLSEQLSSAEQSLRDLEKELEGKYPRYSDLKKPRLLSVDELQNILKPDKTFLCYTVTKNMTVAFIISKDRFKLIELEVGREELCGLIGKFRKGLDDVRELKDMEKFKPEVAYELYQKVFLPVAEELEGVTNLYITADDILYTLPFEALVSREMDRNAFRAARKQGKRGEGTFLGEYALLHYLIEDYTITYLPSASVLRSLRKYEKPGYGEWDKPLVTFADPIFGLEESKGKGSGIKSKGISDETELAMQILTRSTGGELPRLVESAEEARVIAEEVKGRKGDMYLRENASEDNIHKANLQSARYLLFSTHGLIGGDFSGVAEPALVLTLVDNPPGVDGFLSMSDVLGLDLNAEVVVLSACNTYGRGESAGRGEGFAGLTRSFMYAGARSLLVSHWSVESAASRDLMVGFFRKVNEGSDRSVALRDAKLEMKRSEREGEGAPSGQLSLAHPFFWAPFVLVGEGN